MMQKREIYVEIDRHQRC